MKIRTGFVSNSSSSSYILGIAKCINFKKLQEELIKNPEFLIELRFCELKDFVKINEYNSSIINNRLELYGFDDHIKVNIDLTEIKETDVICYVTVSNDEGDGYFYNSITGDMNYDISLEFFNKTQQEIYHLMFNPEIFDQNKQAIIFGVDRNG